MDMCAKKASRSSAAVCAVVAVLSGFAALADVVEVSSDVELAAAVQDAGNAGKTIRLMNDITVGNVGLTVSGITVDLNGKTFSNSSGDFMYVSSGVGDLKFVNGTFYTPGSVIVLQSAGAGSARFENCVFTGLCFVYGSYGSVSLSNCVSTCDYILSPGNGPNFAFTTEDCVISSSQGMPEINMITALGAGYYNFDPSRWIASEYYASAESGTERGVAYNYVVRKYPSVAKVISSDGATTNEYVTFAAAVAGCVSGGETVVLLDDISLSGSIAISGSMTFDLDGHELSNTSGDFISIVSGSLVFRNGSLSSPGSIFILSGGSAKLEECEIGGLCMLYGTSGTLTFESGTLTSRLFVSRNCQSAVNLVVNGGTIAPTLAASDADDGVSTGAQVSLNGGRFSFYAPGWAASGKAVVYSRSVVDGIDTCYAVEDASDKKDGWFLAGGVEYASIGEAVAACAAGGTVTFLGDCNFGDSAFRPAKDVVFDLNGYCFANGVSDFIYPEAGVHLVFRNGTIYKNKAITQSLFMVNNSQSVVIDVENCSLAGYCLVYGFGTLNLDAECSGDLFCMGSVNGSAGVNVAGGRYSFSQWRDTTADQGTGFSIAGGWWALDPTAYLARPDRSEVVDYGESFRDSGLRSRYFVKSEGGFYLFVR